MEEEYQQPYINVPFSQMHDGLLQYQLDPNEIIENVKNTLLGKKAQFNPNTGAIEWKDSDLAIRHINEKGMSALLVPLQSRLTKIFVLSDLDDEKIENMTISVADNIIDILLEHWDEYGVKSISSSSMIVSLIVDTVNATLCKARKANYLHFLKTAQRIVETQQYRVGQPQQQQQQTPQTKSGILGKMFNKR